MKAKGCHAVREARLSSEFGDHGKLSESTSINKELAWIATIKRGLDGVAVPRWRVEKTYDSVQMNSCLIWGLGTVSIGLVRL